MSSLCAGALKRFKIRCAALRHKQQSHTVLPVWLCINKNLSAFGAECLSEFRLRNGFNFTV